MLTKKALYLAFLLLGLAACNKPEPVTKSTWPDGSPKLVVFYMKENGTKTKVKEAQYYENGQMEYTGTFDPDGRRHGDWKYWYDNGNLWSEGTFEHGDRAGNKKVYWPSGLLRYEGQYKDNREAGVWKFYNQEGRQDNEVDFDKQATTEKKP